MLGTTDVTAGITHSGSSLVGELSGNEAGGMGLLKIQAMGSR